MTDELNGSQYIYVYPIRHGLGVRIAGSHPAGPGSTPRVGNKIFKDYLSSLSNENQISTRMRFESTRAAHIRLAFQRPNHSTASSFLVSIQISKL